MLGAYMLACVSSGVTRSTSVGVASLPARKTISHSMSGSNVEYISWVDTPIMPRSNCSVKCVMGRVAVSQSSAPRARR